MTRLIANGCRQLAVAMLLLAGGAVAAVAAEGSADGAPAERFVDVWGPAVGAQLPLLEARDHTGQMRTLGDLTGERGLLLFLYRSADW